MCAFIFNYNGVFPEDDIQWRSIQFTICVALFSVASVPMSMSIATPFNDPKIANAIGGLILFLPTIIFMWLAQQ